jgi:hypothetical protein
MEKINKICQIMKTDKWRDSMIFINSQKPIEFNQFLDYLIENHKKGAILTDIGLINLLNKDFKREFFLYSLGEIVSNCIGTKENENQTNN